MSGFTKILESSECGQRYKNKFIVSFVELVKCKTSLLLPDLLHKSQFKIECMIYIYICMHVRVYTEHFKIYELPPFGG